LSPQSIVAAGEATGVHVIGAVATGPLNGAPSVGEIVAAALRRRDCQGTVHGDTGSAPAS